MEVALNFKKETILGPLNFWTGIDACARGDGQYAD
jgi:hypothetical protein